MRNALDTGDCRSTRRCLEGLGVDIAEEAGAPMESARTETGGPETGRGAVALTVRGVGLRGLREPAGVLDAENSGTTIRLLAGLLAGLPLYAVLTGDPSLLRRPMQRVASPLRAMGARIEGREGGRLPPLTLLPGDGTLRAVDQRLEVASAQVKSALLLAALRADGPLRLSGRIGSRDHTERLFRALGLPLREEIAPGGAPALVAAPPAAVPAFDLTVPGDPSSAAFWLAAALVSGRELAVRGCGLNPTRLGFLRVLERMGAALEVEPEGEAGGEPVGTIRVRPGALRGTTVEEEEAALPDRRGPAGGRAGAVRRGGHHGAGSGGVAGEGVRPPGGGGPPGAGRGGADRAGGGRLHRRRGRAAAARHRGGGGGPPDRHGGRGAGRRGARRHAGGGGGSGGRLLPGFHPALAPARRGGGVSEGVELRFRFGGFTSTVRLLPALGPLDLSAPGGTLPVFDGSTWRLFGRALLPGGGPRPLVLPPGERAKTLGGAGRVLREAVRRGLGRDGRIVGVGGGVVGDLSAFCASLYMRGCRLTLVPTTLLAMVDAALGGKAAVDLPGAKNAAGSFWPAEEVLVAPAALASLPEREFRSGLAEVVKTALLGDGELLRLLEEERGRVLAREPALLAEVVERCLRVKGGVVEEDFRDSGRREILNLGHTFGHALETEGGFRRWTHGEGVAWGLKMAVRLGERLGATPPEHARRVEALLAASGLELRPRPLDPGRLLRHMGADKKKREGRLRFVLSLGVGRTEVRAVEEETVLELLRAEG